MLEKTFIDNINLEPSFAGTTVEARASYRKSSLAERRAKTVSHLALLFSVPFSSIQIVEGLDEWSSNMGRYEGEALIGNRCIKFVSQSYHKSNNEIYTHVVVRDLAKC